MGIIEFLLPYLLGEGLEVRETRKLQNAVKLANDAYSANKSGRGDGLIPLGVFPSVYESILYIMAGLIGSAFAILFVLAIQGVFERTMNLVTLGLGLVFGFVLFILHKSDARYMLDTKSKRLVFVKSFLGIRSIKAIASFGDILMVAIDSREPGGDASDELRVNKVVLVRKNLQRITVTEETILRAPLSEIADLAALVIGCEHGKGKDTKAARVLGMKF